jgi:hypothetical protein
MTTSLTVMRRMFKRLQRPRTASQPGQAGDETSCWFSPQSFSMVKMMPLLPAGLLHFLRGKQPCVHSKPNCSRKTKAVKRCHARVVQTTTLDEREFKHPCTTASIAS